MKIPTFVRASCLLLSAVCSGLCLAQESMEYSDRAEQLFQTGLQRFGSGAYGEAVKDFDGLLTEFPACQRVTAAWVMKGKALLRMGDYLEASRTFKAFVAKYPGSTYTSDAEAMLGEVYNHIGRFEEGLQSYIAAWRRLPSPVPDRLWREILAGLDTIIDAHVSVTSLERMIGESATGGERAYYWLKIAEKEAERDNLVAARAALDTLSFRYGDINFSPRIERVKSRITARGAVKLGVLLPLMKNADPSAIKDVGNEVFEGVEYALEEYEKDPSSGVNVTLEIRDTERDQTVAVKGVEELAAMKDVIGIIGPVFSTTTTAAASTATLRAIPLISPTANANGIAATGQYVFQANPDYDTRGRAMANFAVRVKGMKTVAVLYPGDTYAKYMADGFITEATRLGAHVLATASYIRGSSDLKPQLAVIRRAAMVEAAQPLISFSGRMSTTELMRFAEIGVPVRRIDSLMNKGSIVPVEWLLGHRTKQELDSLGINVVHDETKVDSLQYTADGVQGLYCPISAPEEIAVVSSQIVYFNLKTQILGGGEWNDFLELNASRRYCNGVIFESDSYIDSNSASYTEFQVGYSMRFKKRASRNVLYGYDTARLVLSLIRHGATSRAALANALTEVRDFQGLHGKIGFSKGRVNPWITVLLYDADAIQKVDEVNVEYGPDGNRTGDRP